jgi:NADH-quinone oxidoreductase subunit E
MAYKFSPKLEEKFQWLLTRYPKKDAVLLPLLHDVQKEVGYLSPESILYVSDRMGLSPARIREVASFYSMFKLTPKGTYLLQICHNISCYLKGADDLVEKAKNLLGVEVGQTSSDGLFTLETAECLASCSTAPVMQVNTWDYHEELDVEKLEKVIQALRQGKCANENYEKRVQEGSIA